jgi:hypothetical protein
VNRAFAFSGNGAAVGLVVVALFWPSAAARSNPSRPNQIQRPRIKDTGLAGTFAKATLGISSIEPALQNVFRKYAFSFQKHRFVLISSEIHFHLFIELPLILF